MFTLPQPIRDISMGGLRVYVDLALPVRESLVIELLLPDQVLTLTGRVAWLSELDEDSLARYEAGLQFILLTPTQRAALETVIARGTELPDQ